MGIKKVIVVRLIVALAAGWLVAAGEIAVFLQLFARDQMDRMGVIAVALGLVSAGICWRRTRSWVPRRATDGELANGFNVHFGWPFVIFLVLIGAPSLGVLTVPFWISARRWPRSLDPEGMTLRNRARLLWRDVTGITQPCRRLGGARVNTWWRIQAGNVHAEVVPNSLAEGKAVLEFPTQALEPEYPGG